MSEDRVLKLKRLQREIGEIQTNRARLEGKKEQMMNDLKTKFGVSNLTEAKKKLSEFEKELDSCNTKVENVIEKMEKVVEVAGG